MENIVKGADLQIFIGGKSIAHATSHQLSISTDTVDVQSKDFGKYGSVEPQKISWEITSENLFTDNGFTQLQNAQLSMQPLTAYFGYASGNAEEGLAPGASYFTPDLTKRISYGQVYITSLSVSAASGDNATMSATFKGVGKISYMN